MSELPSGPFRVTKPRSTESGRRELLLPDGGTSWDLESGRYRRLFRGVCVSASIVVTPVVRAKAAMLLVDPRSVASHHGRHDLGWHRPGRRAHSHHVRRPTAASQRVEGARRAASLVRAGVDSPMESRLRMLMILAGLPEPVINHTIRWPDGTIRFRFALSYPDHRLIIEYDGRQHAGSGEQWDVDVDRREWMAGESWRLVVVRSKDVYRTPAQTLSLIVGAMRDKGMGVPRLSDEWRRHFPSLPEDVADPA